MPGHNVRLHTIREILKLDRELRKTFAGGFNIFEAHLDERAAIIKDKLAARVKKTTPQPSLFTQGVRQVKDEV